MRQFLFKVSTCFALCLPLAGAALAQSSTPPAMAVGETPASAPEFVPSGKLWGYAFGDLAYKGSGDTINGGGRGGSNQYTRIPVNSNLFQFRRVYLGYNYEISPKFSAEFVLAAEDDIAAGVLGQGTGDVLADNKFAPYVKIANVRWKNIYKNADLVIGQFNTPGYAKTGKNAQTSEELWGYRAIERVAIDIRRTPSFDFGAALQGTFDKNGNFGYIAMVANGQSARPENDMFKAFYGDLFAKFMNKKLVVDLYQDYQKLNWTNVVAQKAGQFHHDRAMTKLFVGYTVPKFTVGVEAAMNTIMGDLQVTGKDGKTYYRTNKAMIFSAFAKGRVYKDKVGFFARYDNYDPSGNLSNVTGDAALGAVKYQSLTPQYDPTTKEQFVTFGFDFTPVKNVHIMPNVWLNTYDCALSADKYSLNANASASKGTDAVYRITFFYIYGK